MRRDSVWNRLLGVEDTIIEEVVEVGDDIVFRVRPRGKARDRCSTCRRRCPGYDRGGARRRWRTLDLGLRRAFLEAEAPRVRCREHGVVVSAVPWARDTARFTRVFEDTVAWLVSHTDQTTVSTLMRIAWRSVGSILHRVVAEGRSQRDPLDGVATIGIDEISYRKGHRYLTVVVDHRSGRLPFATEGKDEAAAQRFFDALGPKRCEAIEVISADAAPAFVSAARRNCPKAVVCMDPFHVVKWATEAVDAIRRSVWNEARRSGLEDESRAIKGIRFALLKNPEDLTVTQQEALRRVQTVNRPLYRAHLLKEQLREVFRLRGHAGVQLLDAWRSWAVRAPLAPFRKVAAAVTKNLAAIRGALTTGITNARVESMNTKMRLIARQAFGFHSHEPPIALEMLKLGGFCPALPQARTHDQSR